MPMLVTYFTNKALSKAGLISTIAMLAFVLSVLISFFLPLPLSLWYMRCPQQSRISIIRIISNDASKHIHPGEK